MYSTSIKMIYTGRSCSFLTSAAIIGVQLGEGLALLIGPN
jgi:ethanolamine utilization microcompartment shell protein EutL